MTFLLTFFQKTEKEKEEIKNKYSNQRQRLGEREIEKMKKMAHKDWYKGV